MITLYSTNCPKCKALEGRLKKNRIDYIVSNDIVELIAKGYRSAPMLEINGQYFDFKQAMTLLKNYESGIAEEFGGVE